MGDVLGSDFKALAIGFIPNSLTFALLVRFLDEE